MRVNLWWKEQQIARRFPLLKGRPDGRDDVDGVEADMTFREATTPETRRREQADKTGGNQVWLQNKVRPDHTPHRYIIDHLYFTLLLLCIE